MNERIKELMYRSNPSGDFSECEWVFENFAELIVNDVLNIVSISGEQCNCSTLFRNISEHFGVTQ